MEYTVEVKSVDGLTTHSTHDSYRDAVDQSDMVQGQVRLSTGMLDTEAHAYAVSSQGCEMDYLEWSSQDDDERNEWELGACGLPTE